MRIHRYHLTFLCILQNGIQLVDLFHVMLHICPVNQLVISILNMFKTNLLLFLVATSSLLNIASAQNPSQSQDLPQGNCAATEVQLKNGQCFPKGCAKQLAKLKTDSTTKKPGVKFTGTAKLTDSKDIEVTLEFPEDKATPILQKDSTGSCVEHALFNFGATLATEAADAATITTGYDETKSVRTVKFVILQSDFGTKVSKDIQTDKVIIKGLFAFKLLANQSNGNAKRILLVSLFGIRAVFNTDLKSLIGTINIAPRTIGDAACKADGTCIQTAKSEIKFCSDEACTTPVDTIALVQGQTFYVRQKVTESGFTTGFKVKKGELNISDGKGLSKTIKPNKEKNEDGSTTYEVKLNFITSNPVTIGATSELASGTTLRMLQETGDNAAVIGSVSAGCIKKDAAQTSCPTAAEVSAFNPKDCGDTSTTSCTGGSFGKLLLVGMVVLSFLM